MIPIIMTMCDPGDTALNQGHCPAPHCDHYTDQQVPQMSQNRWSLHLVTTISWMKSKSAPERLLTWASSFLQSVGWSENSWQGVLVKMWEIEMVNCSGQHLSAEVSQHIKIKQGNDWKRRNSCYATGNNQSEANTRLTNQNTLLSSGDMRSGGGRTQPKDRRWRLESSHPRYQDLSGINQSESFDLPIRTHIYVLSVRCWRVAVAASWQVCVWWQHGSAKCWCPSVWQCGVKGVAMGLVTRDTSLTSWAWRNTWETWRWRCVHHPSLCQDSRHFCGHHQGQCDNEDRGGDGDTNIDEVTVSSSQPSSTLSTGNTVFLLVNIPNTVFWLVRKSQGQGCHCHLPEGRDQT